MLLLSRICCVLTVGALSRVAKMHLLSRICRALTVGALWPLSRVAPQEGVENESPEQDLSCFNCRGMENASPEQDCFPNFVAF